MLLTLNAGGIAIWAQVTSFLKSRETEQPIKHYKFFS